MKVYQQIRIDRQEISIKQRKNRIDIRQQHVYTVVGRGDTFDIVFVYFDNSINLISF